MTPDSLAAFNSIRLGLQYTLRPAALLVAGQPYTGRAFTERYEEQLVSGGLQRVCSRKFQLRKSDCPERPKPHSTVEIDARRYKITEVVDLNNTGEWQLLTIAAS